MKRLILMFILSAPISASADCSVHDYSEVSVMSRADLQAAYRENRDEASYIAEKSKILADLGDDRGSDLDRETKAFAACEQQAGQIARVARKRFPSLVLK